MGKVEEKKKKKLEALFLSGFELFTEKGFNNTSVSDIVNRAKLAKGTFYLYFKDKFDLKDQLIRHQAEILFEKANKEMESQKFDSLEDEVIALADSVINQLAANPSLLRFISKNLSWAVFANIRIAGMDNMDCMKIFDQMIAESGRHFRNVDLMIYMMVELINSTCHSVILDGTPVSLKDLKPDLYQTLRNIIAQFEIKE